LPVGNNQGAESAEPIEGLVPVLLGRRLIDGSIGERRVAAFDPLTLPDEVLEEIALILRQKQKLRFLNDVTEISNQLLALSGKFLRGIG
jgi:hypothetical protein